MAAAGDAAGLRRGARRPGAWRHFAAVALIGPRQVGKTTLALAIGVEIDLLLERPDGEFWAIEINRGLSGKPERSFHHAIADLEPARALLLHPGNDRYPIAERIEAIGLRLLAEELSSAG